MNFKLLRHSYIILSNKCIYIYLWNRLVKDYIIWVCVWKFGRYGSGPFQEASYNFQSEIYGITERPKPWYKCIVELEETMEFGLAALYVTETLSQKGKTIVINSILILLFFSNLRTIFKIKDIVTSKFHSFFKIYLKF